MGQKTNYIEDLTMHIRIIITALFLCLVSSTALAQLDPWTDYDISDELWNITLVNVDPNLGDDYLEGLRDTWIAANKVAKELGQIEDFKIFRSQLPQSGNVNLFLVVKYANSDSLDPNREEYDKFMKAWGEANEAKTREITKNYPAMRKITGEYLVREITVK
jgi:hypothetical protein